MNRKVKAGWRLLLSSLLVLLLLGGMFWLLRPPAQAAETAVPIAPTSVTVAGDLQSELGCAGDWDPGCVATHITDAGNGIWRGVFDVPTGSWNYKMALNDTWDSAFPSGNKPLVISTVPTEMVRFYFDDKTNAVLDSVNDVIAVGAGSFQSELGCPGDWQPDCVRTLLTDPNGDGIYTFVSADIPVGSYETKVALNETWDTSYPGANVAFSVATAGEIVTLAFDTGDNSVAVTIAPPAPSSVTIAGDLQSELGCPGDWQPDCALTNLTAQGNDVWRGVFDVPTGSWSYKAALNGTWDVSYPPSNKSLAVTGSPTETVRFYYDHKTNAVLDSVNDVTAVAVGNFQGALGCASDWQPACLISLMTDTDADGV
ncbi:MAG: hypothetical protein KC441_16570, partial [Anaerolineales bacterium]|nr:hypothetical protein [Anaerolineales bacterium]